MMMVYGMIMMFKPSRPPKFLILGIIHTRWEGFFMITKKKWKWQPDFFKTFFFLFQPGHLWNVPWMESSLTHYILCPVALTLEFSDHIIHNLPFENSWSFCLYSFFIRLVRQICKGDWYALERIALKKGVLEDTVPDQPTSEEAQSPIFKSVATLEIYILNIFHWYFVS